VREVAVASGKEPVTLMQVHELMVRERPRRDAPKEVWLAYYRRSAGLYEEVADIDRGHHHEALYWARWERKRADQLASDAKIGPDHGA
jgi:hypothetical protein